ncbi:hypothetical protein tb265_07930 [Gemmatimonadetes bacterium T265]|nr:hypothetical protein tb265_07930 [Gemmatimonadetes bacterium T265]
MERRCWDGGLRRRGGEFAAQGEQHAADPAQVGSGALQFVRGEHARVPDEIEVRVQLAERALGDREQA